MTEYKIKYAPDEMLGGRNFVLCDEGGKCVTLVLRRGVRDLPDDENAAVWVDAWVAYNALVAGRVQPPPSVPAQKAIPRGLWATLGV